jgi:pimeloyl-ACP methyl ester carboxylesterase
MPKFDSQVGRYIYLTVQGTEHRVYFEEAGQGIPLICQHTAATQGQQWRHLMNDKDITDRFHVIAADLPYHGKSLPPESKEWWKKEYRLTKSFFIDFHLELIRALELERPIYIGCSMGGFLAPELALEYPDKFRAVIGIEADLGGSGRSPGDWFSHPRIGTFSSAVALHMSGPECPEKYKWQCVWLCGIASPSASMGDMHYSFVEHDLRETARNIDTSKIPVYLMTGEYDAMKPPEVTRKLADQIKGSKLVLMKGLGHFAMAENPEVFKTYLMPILDEIERRK